MEINNAVGHTAISSERGIPKVVCALLKIHKCVPRCLEEMACTGPVSDGQLPEPVVGIMGKESKSLNSSPAFATSSCVW